jgi:UDP-N-acetylglucosamine--N-acetylmuramyl-(pentapeptide) pyrophosphoryl-undecaprenol N-acetylglucosamine transferase
VTKTILFAGGGTGGHIFPSVAVWERLANRDASLKAHFVVSARPLDGEILRKRKLMGTAIGAQPLRLSRPWTWPGFAHAWRQSIDISHAMIRDMNVVAVVATGGFVAGPVVRAAAHAKLPIALVNLDAVPGKANAYLARHATERFTVYPVAAWPDARHVGLPLSAASVGPDDQGEARRGLGLDPDRSTLFVTGGSQGAESINRTMIRLMTMAPVRSAMAGWQVLHLAGPGAAENQVLDDLKAAYRDAGLTARVETFCNMMGLAWRAASMAIARAGAGTVAEVWANAAPTIFLPYPHHRDQHQRRNAQPLVDSGAAMVETDRIDAELNARQLAGPICALVRNSAQRRHMTERLRATNPQDGARVICNWLIGALDRR